MNRFQKGHPGRALLRGLLPAACFALVLGLFLTGLDDISGMTARQEAEALERSIRQGAVHCYATEGFYPDSLAYLEEHYGLRYDKNKYVVSYEIIGSNLMPGITVIRLN